MAVAMHRIVIASYVVHAGASHGSFLGQPWGWTDEASGQNLFFESQQDNFDMDNTNTWKQAYYVNDKFWSGANSRAPVFLYVGGEGTLSSSSVTSNFITDWLPRLKGLMFSVEHRYYGCIRNVSSCPYGNKTSNHLSFLSSHQALADLATFHAFASKTYGLSADTKWIVVGGSYPGMLAAFLRAEYPDLFHSAIASSAPVKATLDMTQFEDAVSSAYALDVEGVHGSPLCRDSIAYGHQEIGKLLQHAEGRERLHKLFPTVVESGAWLENPTNQRTFAGCGVASFPAQANSPTCKGKGCGISQICSIMTNKSLGTELERLAHLRAAQDSNGLQMTSTCEMDWERPGDVAKDMDERSVNLYWGYQTCTEFGFYQTCEVGSDCFFTQGLVSFDNPDHKPNDFCSKLFGFSTVDTVKAIKKTTDHYNAKVAAATRIMWVNGNVDPWHGRSHLSPPGAHQPIIWPVQGAGHCAWMAGETSKDQRSLVEARHKILAQLSQWLQDEVVV